MRYDDWNGVLDGREDAAEARLVDVCPRETRRRCHSTHSEVYLGRADDGHKYWIEPTRNRNGAIGSAVEQVVGRAGALIGAPVPAVRILSDPDHLSIRTGRAGLVHGSRDVGEAEELAGRGITNYDAPNAARIPAWVALWDWCWGGNFHYLETTEGVARSHDHGEFFPFRVEFSHRSERRDRLPVVLEALEERADVPHAILTADPSRVPQSAVSEVARTLRNLSGEDVVREVLRPVPTSWRVGRRLEAIGAFLEHRAPAVADRLEDRLLAPSFVKGGARASEREA